MWQRLLQVAQLSYSHRVKIMQKVCGFSTAKLEPTYQTTRVTREYRVLDKYHHKRPGCLATKWCNNRPRAQVLRLIESLPRSHCQEPSVPHDPTSYRWSGILCEEREIADARRRPSRTWSSPLGLSRGELQRCSDELHNGQVSLYHVVIIIMVMMDATTLPPVSSGYFKQDIPHLLLYRLSCGLSWRLFWIIMDLPIAVISGDIMNLFASLCPRTALQIFRLSSLILTVFFPRTTQVKWNKFWACSVWKPWPHMWMMSLLHVRTSPTLWKYQVFWWEHFL